VDACTVTALDAITAFAVPNPNCASQSQSVFSGLVALRVSGIGSVSSGLTFPYISLLIGPLSALERKIVEKLRFASMPVAASHVD